MRFPGRNQTRRNLPEDPDEFRLSLVEHLEELRDRIIRALLILIGGWVIGWFIFEPLYFALQAMIDGAVKPNLPENTRYEEIVLGIPDLFVLKLRLSFVVGLVIAFPFLVLQLWGFIAPALKPEERKPIQRLAPVSVILFAMGAGFCWMIIPTALAWFVSFASEFPGIAITPEAGNMVYFILKMLLAFGVAFQLPLIVYALGALGLLSGETLLQYWRQAAAVIFVASAILTPSNDAISMLMMAVPLVILFSISVYFVRLTQRKKRKEEEAAEAEEEAFLLPATRTSDPVE